MKFTFHSLIVTPPPAADVIRSRPTIYDITAVPQVFRVVLPATVDRLFCKQIPTTMSNGRYRYCKYSTIVYTCERYILCCSVISGRVVYASRIRVIMSSIRKRHCCLNLDLCIYR